MQPKSYIVTALTAHKATRPCCAALPKLPPLISHRTGIVLVSLPHYNVQHINVSPLIRAGLIIQPTYS